MVNNSSNINNNDNCISPQIIERECSGLILAHDILFSTNKEKVVKLSYQENRCNVVLNVKIAGLDPYN
jgi:hypothetical protein